VGLEMNFFGNIFLFLQNNFLALQHTEIDDKKRQTQGKMDK
jgi:hypothetical protein